MSTTILPNKIYNLQNLSFRLRLDVQFDVKSNDLMGLGLTKTTNGIRIEDKIDSTEYGLDMDFEIERTDGTDPSTATLTIWNMSNDLFNQISNNANIFEMYYARGNDDWSLLFRGTPYYSSQDDPLGGNNNSRGFLKKNNESSGQNDISTTISLTDSLHAFDSATISKSYQGNVSTKTIIIDCVNAMGIALGDDVSEHKEINNFVARGKVRTILNEVCGKIGCKHIIENGTLHLYNSSNKKVYGYKFNPDNSSRPKRFQEDDITGYSFTTQLLPNMRAGQYCVCDFDTLQGTREIFKVKLTGNNYGTAGEMEVWVK